MTDKDEINLAFFGTHRSKRVFFLEDILSQSFLGKLGFFFDRFMRAYAKFFLLFIIICLIVNEFASKIYMLNFILCYCFFNFVIIIIAYYFHCRLRDFIGNDVNKLILMNMTNGVDRRVDIISLITLRNLKISSEIKTVNPLADIFLMNVQAIPFLHNLTWTIMDHNYFRFSWLQADKSNSKEFGELLNVGDSILYHSKKSVIGWIIRFLTRCYWEHTALYIGNNQVVDVVPGGIRLVNIMDWVQDDNIELAVLRPTNINYTKVFVEECKKHIGGGYSYYKVFIELWRILTNKKGDGLMKLHIFLVNILLYLIVIFLLFWVPDLTRLHLILLAIFPFYLFDTVYHWWAYKKQFDDLCRFEFLKEYKEQNK